MRVLILSDVNSSHTRKWALSLLKKGVDTGVFSLMQMHGDPMDTKGIPLFFPEGNNQELHASNTISKLKYLRSLSSVKKAIRKFKPDVVHAHYATSYGLLGTLSGFHPLVVSAWGTDVMDFPGISVFHKSMLKYILYKADEICVTSRILEKETSRLTSRKLHIIPFGIDCNVFRPYPKGRNHPFTIGVAKGLEKVYGTETVIKAFSLLIKENPDKKLKLLIVGDGSQRQYLEDLAKEEGIDKLTVFTGRKTPDEMPAFFNQMDILVNVSHYESFGVSVLEASACGKCIIASNVGGMPEVVDDGVTGILIKPNDSELLKETMDLLLKNESLRILLGENGRKKVLAAYDLETCVDKQIEIYKNLLEKKTSSASAFIKN